MNGLATGLRTEICLNVSCHSMNIGKWYDPITQRWIVPREVISAAICQLSSERVLEVHKSEAQRIWDALVDCCAHG